MSNFSEIVGHNCYTSNKWNRDICQAVRVDYAGFRFYRHYKGNEDVYRKGATFLSDTITSLTGQGKFLESWRKDMIKELGTEGFDSFMNAMADFGTVGHILYDLLVQNRATIEAITLAVKGFAEENKLNQVATYKAIETAKKNTAAFLAFNKEHDIEIFAIEQMVTSDKLATSTPVDILATGMFSRTKGARKEKCWLLGNLKTSENTQNHSFQCAIEYACAKESIFEQLLSIENLPIVVGTIRAKDWRKDSGPSFEFKNYTDFATNPDNIALIEKTAEILISAGRMNPPNIESLIWEGPLTHETVFNYEPLF